MKGIMDQKWQRIQEKYVVSAQLSKKYNIKLWIKGVTELLLNHCVDCYKERCIIINAENHSSHDQHIRQQAHALLLDLKANPWKLQHNTKHLLSRNKFFFETSLILNVNEWVKSVNTELERGNRRTLEVTTDIRDFFPASQPEPRPKNRSIIAFKQQLRNNLSDIRSRV